MTADINHNLSALNTAYTTLARKPKQALSYATYVTELMQAVEAAIEARNHKDLLLHQLVHFEILLRFDIPLNIRPELFRKLNHLLSHMSLTHTDDRKLCQVFLQLITLVKNQIDAKEQSAVDSNEREWEELQLSVFLISEWENASAN